VAFRLLLYLGAKMRVQIKSYDKNFVGQSSKWLKEMMVISAAGRLKQKYNMNFRHQGKPSMKYEDIPPQDRKLI